MITNLIRYLFLVAAVIVSATKVANPNIAIQRRNEVALRLKNSSLLVLTDKNFSKYVTDRPRLYTAAVMFTALNEKYQCSVCVRTKDQFEAASKQYSLQYDFNSTAPATQMAFFIVDVEQAQSTFELLGFQTVPHIYALPPRDEQSPKLKMADYEVDVRESLDGLGPLLAVLTRVSGIPVYQSYEARPVLAMLLIVAFIAALVIAAAGTTSVQAALLWYRHPAIWAAVSLVCFSVGVSGSIYCFIKSVPLYGFQRGGGIEVFGGQGREQFLGEGIIVAGWSVACGLAGFLLFASSKMKRFPLMRHVVALLAMSIFLVLLGLLFEAYSFKTRWYSVKETLPPEVWAFFASSVKKSSGLAKRLMRLSEVWLFEFKDWEGFQKKGRAIVVDHVARVALELYAYVNNTQSL